MILDLDVYTDMWGIPYFGNRGSPVLLINNIPNRFQFTLWMPNARPAEGAVRDTFSDHSFALEVPHGV